MSVCDIVCNIVSYVAHLVPLLHIMFHSTPFESVGHGVNKALSVLKVLSCNEMVKED